MVRGVSASAPFDSEASNLPAGWFMKAENLEAGMAPAAEAILESAIGDVI